MQNNQEIPYDIIGMRVGKLTVVSVAGKDKNNRYIYSCKCDCGNFVKQRRSDLLGKKYSSCGCLKEEKAKTNIIGMKFKCVTVVDFDHKEDCKASNGVTQNKYFFKVKCEKGKEFVMEKNKLKGYKLNFDCCDLGQSGYKKKTIFDIEFNSDYSEAIVYTNLGTKRINIRIDPRDIINTKIGNLTPLEIVGAKFRTSEFDFDYIYKCKCTCGTICERSRYELFASANPSCKNHNKLDMRSIDMLGKYINNWYIVSSLPKIDGEFYYQLECQNCKSKITVSRDDIINSNIPKCSCQNKNLRKVIRFIN